jgi:hypothetical protein
MTTRPEKSLLRTLEATGQNAAALKQISEIKNRDVPLPINFSIRFHPEVNSWLKVIVRTDYENLAENSIQPSVQKVAVGILDQVRVAYENSTNTSTTRALDESLESSFAGIAEQSREKIRESANYNIRFTPALATWLKEMAQVQMRLIGKPVTLQQAANAILLMAKREHEE